MRLRSRFALVLALLVLVPAASALAVTSPRQQLGADVGDDYVLFNYTQLSAYWHTLARESGRVSLVEIGRSAEDRPILMAVITAPENQKRLGRFKSIARRLALAEGLTGSAARSLAAEGRAVVWIDGGLHATEVAPSQHLFEMAYQMASRDDEETRRFLRDDILLLVCPNPDGMELVADWYMRDRDPAARSMAGLPRLYQKYIGHDNNRDFYMNTQPETRAVNRQLYREWFPQIVYNQHQSGPAGTVLFAPPFRDPFNYAFDSLVPVGIDLVAAAMHNRFISEGKPGATMRSGASYSTWWNGGLRSTSYFHNMIGILTEIIGGPTPTDIPFLPGRLLPGTDLPDPVAPQTWHFRRTIDYLVTADRAILDIASKDREGFLFRTYLMARNSIDKGRTDHWTFQPADLAAVEEALKKDKVEAPKSYGQGYPKEYYDRLRDPARRDPRGFIIPSSQPDFPTAVKFVNILLETGVKVERAVSEFRVGSRTYPSGSFIVKSDQAFRPHLLTMFEPQDHPNDFAYPGGPPVPPYDSAGWTLAFQMGVSFDRILDGFDGPFEEVRDPVAPPPGHVAGEAAAAGYLLSHRVNDGFIAVNRLLKAGEDVYWLKDVQPGDDSAEGPGRVYVKAGPAARAILEKAASELGLEFKGTTAPPAGPALKLKPVRIGLWDQYGGSMASGWMRWLLERFEFPFERVYAPALDAGDLRSKYDVLILVSGAVPRPAAEEDAETSFYRPAVRIDPARVPAEYQAQLGSVTLDKTVPRLGEFIEQGGTVLALGRSTGLAYLLGLPVENGLTEQAPGGRPAPLPREKFYVPGSLLRVRVDSRNPVAYGMPETVDVMFDDSPAFRLLPDSEHCRLTPVAWFDSDKPLRSGWAWGQNYLRGTTAVVEAGLGTGKLLLYGPEVVFRGQPHGTFKLVFNGILYGGAEPVELR
jgi:hypothetical protein